MVGRAVSEAGTTAVGIVAVGEGAGDVIAILVGLGVEEIIVEVGGIPMTCRKSFGWILRRVRRNICAGLLRAARANSHPERRRARVSRKRKMNCGRVEIL